MAKRTFLLHLRRLALRERRFQKYNAYLLLAYRGRRAVYG